MPFGGSSLTKPWASPMRQPPKPRQTATWRGCSVSVRFIRDSDLGWGRSVDDGEDLRFFDSPTQPEIVLTRAGRTFRAQELPAQERVWWFDGDKWMVGRIDGPKNSKETEYYVHFPNERTDPVPAAELRVRWSRPLTDPLALVMAGTVETRYFHTKRTAFLHSVAEQRAACVNLRGLLSSAVEIFEHQVGAARRVLSDPVPRYLLADEVGLGKTIEAGMVIRQIMLDSAGSITVLAPDHLVGQWENELDNKFRVAELPGEIRVVAHSAIEDLSRGPRTLLVVDEAHRFTDRVRYGDSNQRAGRYNALTEIAHAAQALLLLSATPVRSNEDGFLGILHLLDPTTYRLDDLAGFRRRVEMRDDLAQALSALDDEAPLRYLKEPLTRLGDLLRDDSTLGALVQAATAAIEDRDNEAVSAALARIRIHVSETYRLHNRMIRNRRSTAIKEHYPVRGRNHGDPWRIIDPDRRRAELFSLLESLRLELDDQNIPDAGAVLRIVLGRTLGPLGAMRDLAAALRGEAQHDLSDDELAGLSTIVGSTLATELSRQIEALLTMEAGTDRISATVEWCRRKVGRGKFALACSFPRSASELAQALIAEFGAHRVTAVLESHTDDERTLRLAEFAASAERNLLVLDRSVEEGVNLQFVRAVLHINLPTVTSQLEQRLGRFDRWSEILQPIYSTVFSETDALRAEHLEAWTRVLDELFDVFRSSTSTLQYVLSDLEDEFFANAIKNGLAGAAEMCQSQREVLHLQSKRISAQDLLDSIEDRSSDEALATGIAAIDRHEQKIETSVVDYVHDMLRFSMYYSDSGFIRFGVDKAKPPLLPESTVTSLGAELFRRTYTATRSAIPNGVGFLRLGEPLVDRFTALAEIDDRGRAFAVEVPMRSPDPARPPMLALCFDFLICAGPLEVVHDDPAFARSVTARTSQHLPTTIERIWWMVGRGECPPKISQDLSDRSGANLGSDPQRFRALTTHFEWPRCCEQTRGLALDRVMTRESVTTRLARARAIARTTAERELGILRARGAATERIALDTNVQEAVDRSLAAPTYALESCGAVFITWIAPS
jgi:ATP-dependent helicase HepA